MKKSDYVKAGINIALGALIVVGVVNMLRLDISKGIIGAIIVFGLALLVVGCTIALVPLDKDPESTGALRITNQVLLVLAIIFMCMGLIGTLMQM
jgi:hypothetical protein